MDKCSYRGKLLGNVEYEILSLREDLVYNQIHMYLKYKGFVADSIRQVKLIYYK